MVVSLVPSLGFKSRHRPCEDYISRVSTATVAEPTFHLCLLTLQFPMCEALMIQMDRLLLVNFLTVFIDRWTVTLLADPTIFAA